MSSNIIKALEEREWIRVVGHRDVPGKPELLATTKTFLDYFGLKRLDELPPLSELREIGELEPQLPFEPSIPAGIGSEPYQKVSGTISPEDTDVEDDQSEIVPDTFPHDTAAAEDDQSEIVPDTISPTQQPTGDDAEPASSEPENQDEQ